MEQQYYYDRRALLKLFDNRGWVKVFLISISTSIGTKKGRIYIKGAPFNEAPQTFGGEVAPNCPQVHIVVYL